MTLLPNGISIIKSLRRITNKICLSSHALSEMKIDGIWKITGGPESKPILIYDNKNVNFNSTIIFALYKGIQFLLKSIICYVDKTFFTCS